MNAPSILSKATGGTLGRPQKLVIYSPEGFGKSTLASQLPEPYFFDIEGSTAQIELPPGRRLGRDVLCDLKTIDAALVEVAKGVPWRTLVIDTADWLEAMIAEELCREYKQPSIICNEKGSEFSFGRGVDLVKTRMTIFLARLDAVVLSGINVALLAHSHVKKLELPDSAGAFDRYELKLMKGVAPLLKEWADMLLFGNWRVQVAEKGKGDQVKYKGVGGRERLMQCTHSAVADAKNRHGLADVEKWDIEVIKKAFASVGAPWLPVVAEATLPARTVKDLKEGTAAAPATTGGNLSASDAAPTPKQPTAPQPATPTEASTLAITALPSTSLPVANGAPGEPATSPCSDHETKPQATSSPAEDHIPGIENPPLVDAELERICGPQSDAVTAYLRERKKITPDQDWRSMPADFATRIKKNPAAFLKAAGAKGGN